MNYCYPAYSLIFTSLFCFACGIITGMAIQRRWSVLKKLKDEEARRG